MKKVLIIVTLLALAGGALALSFGPFPSGARGDPVFWNELGYSLSAEGNVDAAQDAFAQAVALDPSYENARKNLYVSAFQNEDYLVAAEHLRVLLESDDNSEYHFDLAQSLVAWARFQADDGTEAVAALEEALVHLDAAGDWPHAAENAVIVRRVLSELL